MKTGDRRGFTLSELMIVAVLGSVMVGATYQIMLSSQRALTIQTAQVQGQQTVRAGLDILFAELRELSRAEADILTMGPDRIEVRAMRAFGLVCGVDASGSPLRVRKMGRFFVAGDSVMVFADNDTDIASDDTILCGMPWVAPSTRPQTCLGGDHCPVAYGGAPWPRRWRATRCGLALRSRGFKIYTYGLYVAGRGKLSGPQSQARGRSPWWGHSHSNGVSFIIQWTPSETSRRTPGRCHADRRDPSVGIGQRPEPAGISGGGFPFNCDLSTELTNYGISERPGSVQSR